MEFHSRILDMEKQIGCSMDFIRVCRIQVTDDNRVWKYLCI